MMYDGDRSDVPVIDHVVDLRFAYYGDPAPTSVTPPPPGSANCAYAAGRLPRAAPAGPWRDRTGAAHRGAADGRAVVRTVAWSVRCRPASRPQDWCRPAARGGRVGVPRRRAPHSRIKAHHSMPNVTFRTCRSRSTSRLATFSIRVCDDAECPHERGDRGSALICVLMVTTLLATLSGALVLVVMSETMASANHGAAQQALYAAEAALDDTLGELQTTDWRALPGAAVSACLRDAALTPRAPDGTVLNLAALAAQRQAESDAVFAAVARPAGVASFRSWLIRRPRGRQGECAPRLPSRLGCRRWGGWGWRWRTRFEQRGDGAGEAYGGAGAHRSIEATVALQVLAGAGADRR